MAQIGHDIARAAQLLNKNEVVGIPTETVYGLAGNALSAEAILKIFKVKNRPMFDPLIAHVSDLRAAGRLAQDIPAPLLRLAEQFWPGPLTLLLPKQKIVTDLLTSGSDLIAIRVPAHPLAQKLLRAVDFPLAAPSANPFGYVSPTTAQHVKDQLGEKIPYILDGGSTEVGIESTIAGMDGELVKIHRLGGLAIESIESIVGEVALELNQSSNPVAPGMLKSHYAPGKKLLLGNVTQHLQEHAKKKIGVISFSKTYDTDRNFVLSEEESLDEAASRLFGVLRSLDKSDVDVILAEEFPNEGLGRAINDRLRRAAAPKSQ